MLNDRIGEALGHDRKYDVVVVGIGNLGRALVNSTNFLIRGAQLAALYDVDPEVIGTEVAGPRGALASRANRPRDGGRDLRTPFRRPRKSPICW